MRKGQFFSIAGLFLLVVLVIIIQTQTNFLEERQEQRVDRAQIGTADSFVRTFLELDIPQVLEVSLKNALIHREAPYTPTELEQTMQDGGSDISVGTDAQFALKSVVLPSESESIVYDIIDIRQNTHDTITVKFLVAVVIPTVQGTWDQEDMPYEVTVDVYGILHPAHGEIITEAWVDAGGGSCLAENLINTADTGITISCSGQIAPPSLEELVA